MNFREELEKIREENNKELDSEKNVERILRNTIKHLKKFSHVTFNNIKTITFRRNDEIVTVESDQTEVFYQYECQTEIDAQQTMQLMKQKLKDEGIQFKHIYKDAFIIFISSVDK